MPTATPIQCPSCGLQIPAGDMDLQTMAARCRGCHSLVDLRPGPASTPPPAAQAAPLPVPMPERLSVAEHNGELHIVRAWFTWTAYLLAFFSLVWWVFLLGWYAIALATGSLLMIAFPVLHVAVGAFLAYWTVACFVNRTEISVVAGRLGVLHTPLPWFGRHDLPTLELEQLFCEQHTHHGRNGTTVTYSVRARTTGGKMVKLVEGLTERDQALFIEQEIERHLAIPNRAVASEMRR
jgi:hypothetical protein